jgi:hypothetical protein
MCERRSVGICCHDSPDAEAIDPPVRAFHTVPEVEFCEVRLARVLGSSHLLRSLTFAAVAFVVESHLSPIRQEQYYLTNRAYRRRP